MKCLTIPLIFTINIPCMAVADIYAYVDLNGVRHLKTYPAPGYKLVMPTPKFTKNTESERAKLQPIKDKSLINNCLEYARSHISWKDRYSVRYEGNSGWVLGKAITLYLNAKNSYGAYGGEEPYTCLINKDNKIAAVYNGHYYINNPSVVKIIPRTYLTPTGTRIVVGSEKNANDQKKSVEAETTPSSVNSTIAAQPPVSDTEKKEGTLFNDK